MCQLLALVKVDFGLVEHIAVFRSHKVRKRTAYLAKCGVDRHDIGGRGARRRLTLADFRELDGITDNTRARPRSSAKHGSRLIRLMHLCFKKLDKRWREIC